MLYKYKKEYYIYITFSPDNMRNQAIKAAKEIPEDLLLSESINKILKYQNVKNRENKAYLLTVVELLFLKYFTERLSEKEVIEKLNRFEKINNLSNFTNN